MIVATVNASRVNPPTSRHDADALRATRQAAGLKVAALVAAGLSTNFTVGLVGAFPVGEFVLAGALGVVVLHLALRRTLPGSLLRSRLLWTFVACQGIALLGYVFSDLSWGSSPNDTARGWARMIFLGLDVVAIAFLFDVPGRRPEIGFIAFQVGYALGGTVATLLGNVLFDDYWKFGWASPVTILVLLLAPRFGFWVGQAAGIALGFLHMVMDFRSLAAICLLVPALTLFQRFPVRQRWLAIGVSGVTALAMLTAGLRLSGRGGENVRASRSDIERSAMAQAAWEGFLRSPWLGNGSWFSKSNVMQEFFAIRYENSIVSGIGSFERDELDNGPTIHSQILACLAEGGLLGGCFFLFYGAMLLWGLGTVVLTHPWRVWSNLFVFFLLLKLCDLATSPFSGAHRVLIAVGVGVILLLWHKMPAPAPAGVPVPGARFSRRRRPWATGRPAPEPSAP